MVFAIEKGGESAYTMSARPGAEKKSWYPDPAFSCPVSGNESEVCVALSTAEAREMLSEGE